MLHFTRALFAVFVTFLLIGAPMTDANAQGAAAVHVVTYLDLAPESVAKAKPLLQLYRDASAKSSGFFAQRSTIACGVVGFSIAAKL